MAIWRVARPLLAVESGSSTNCAEFRGQPLSFRIGEVGVNQRKSVPHTIALSPRTTKMPNHERSMNTNYWPSCVFKTNLYDELVSSKSDKASSTKSPPFFLNSNPAFMASSKAFTTFVPSAADTKKKGSSCCCVNLKLFLVTCMVREHVSCRESKGRRSWNEGGIR